MCCLNRSRVNYAKGGTWQIYCFRSGHRQSGQPPRTKESSESPQRLATILHHGILNLMFNAVDHPPSQIHIHSHTVARSFSDPFTVEIGAIQVPRKHFLLQKRIGKEQGRASTIYLKV